jgi:hypothetical protein
MEWRYIILAASILCTQGIPSRVEGMMCLESLDATGIEQCGS